MLEVPEWVNVIALTPDNEVILVEQYRFGIGEPTLEIPGGMVDPGESPDEAVRRELLEETGYRTGSLTELGRVSANPAIQNNYTWCYLAENCRYEGADNPDPHEYIEVHKTPKKHFLELIADGTIHHAIVMAAVAKWLLLRET